MLTVDSVRRALERYQPRRLTQTHELRHAAVAAIVRDGDDGAELLLIHRAEDERDPWSGHMGFPGGRVEEQDASPLGAAAREAMEEVALDLERDAELLGQLSDVDAIGRGRRVGMVIIPYVFALCGEPALRPNHEVQAIVWVPLAFLADRSNRETMQWTRLQVPVTLPCYRYQGSLIWGLTLGMVDELLEIIGLGRGV